MGFRDWDRSIRNGEAKQRIRDELERDGNDPNIKPTHRWLIKKGFSGIQNYASRESKTVDQVLLSELNFDQPDYQWDVEHDETEEYILRFYNEEENKMGAWTGKTLSTVRTSLNRYTDFALNARNSDDLISPHGHEKPVSREIFLQICGEMEEKVGDSTCKTYAQVTNQFFEYLVDCGRISENRFAYVFDRKDYSTNREAPKEADVPSASEVKKLYETDDIVLKTAVLLLAGAGDRPQSVHKRTISDLDLSLSDPKIYSGSENKTGPSGNALMAGIEFLQNLAETRADDQDGDEVYLFPSSMGKKPHLCYGTIYNRIKTAAAEHDVRKHSGDPIVPKNLKQFYLNEVAEADIQFRRTAAKRATESVGDSKARVKDEHYIHNRQNRDNFREFAHAKFSVAFPDSLTMKEIRKARERHSRPEDQSGLEDFL